MPLRIPTNSQTGYKVSLSEFICATCDSEFYVSPQTSELLCPFCGRGAFVNGDVEIIVKAGKKEKEIDYEK